MTDSEADQLYQVRAATQQVSAAQLSPGSRPQLAVHNPLTNEIVWWDAQAAAIKTSRLDGTAVRVVRSLRGTVWSLWGTVWSLWGTVWSLRGAVWSLRCSVVLEGHSVVCVGHSVALWGTMWILGGTVWFLGKGV